MKRHWQRRIAAMRIFHIWVAATSLLPVFSLVVLTSQRVLGGSFFPVLVILIIALTITLLRRWAFRRNYSKHIGSPVDLKKFPHIAEIQAQIARVLARPLEDIEIRIVINRKAAPAQVFEAPNKRIYVLLRVESLQTGNQRSTLFAAVIWHELGHYIQWDTKLGYWTLHSVDRFGFMMVCLGGAGVLVVGSFVAILAIRNQLAPQVIFALFLECLAFVFLVAVLWFMRHWRRFSEHNADMVATLVGYGEPLAAYLSTIRYPNQKFMGLIGFHPLPKTRVKVIRAFLNRLQGTQREGGWLDEQNMQTKKMQDIFTAAIYFKDYVYALFMYVVPIFLLFACASMSLFMVIAVNHIQTSNSHVTISRDNDVQKSYALTKFLNDLDGDIISDVHDSLEINHALSVALEQQKYSAILAAIDTERSTLLRGVARNRTAAKNIIGHAIPKDISDKDTRELIEALGEMSECHRQQADAFQSLLNVNRKDPRSALNAFLNHSKHSDAFYQKAHARVTALMQTAGQ